MASTSSPAADHLLSLHQNVLKAKAELRDAIRAAHGHPVTNYTFSTTAGPRSLADLFNDKDDLLVIHNMGRHCNYCSLWGDAVSGLSTHITQRASIVLSAPDDAGTLEETARQRGWSFPVVSTMGSTFAGDMGYATPDGRALPGVSAFWRDAHGNITRTGSTGFGPGDDFCAVWPLFDLLRDGAKGWQPR